MTFIKVTRINSYGEEKELHIFLEDIKAIDEKHVEPTTLYDENGNEIETRENPKDYTIIVSRDNFLKSYHIREEEKDRLVKLLENLK